MRLDRQIKFNRELLRWQGILHRRLRIIFWVVLAVLIISLLSTRRGRGFLGSVIAPFTTSQATIGNINTTLNAATFPGADIAVKISNAYAACSAQCKIYVPAGNYTGVTNQIVLPLNVFGTYELQLDPGAQIFYTGTSFAIFAPIGAAGPGSSHLIIEGGQLIGTSAALGGIHIQPTNGVTIQNMLIEGFSAGDGIQMEGVNASNILNNLIQNNLNGVHIIPTFCTGSYPYTCSPTTTGSAWSPNALHVWLNNITNNGDWGIFDERGAVSGGGWTGSLNNSYMGNDLELNGNVGGSAFGAIYMGKSTTATVAFNYFEGSPREVVLGEAGAGAFFAATGTQVLANFFTTRTATLYNIELENTSGAHLEGNGEQISSSNSSNCFINALSGGEVGTYVDKNFYLQGVGATPGNSICVAGTAAPLTGAGSFPIVNSNYQYYIAYQAFNTAASATESVTIAGITTGSSCFVLPQNASASANLVGSYISAYGTGTITFTHPATANMHFDISCAKGPFN